MQTSGLSADSPSMLPRGSSQTSTRSPARPEAFLALAFIGTVCIWSVCGVVTLIGLVTGRGVLPPKMLFLTADFIFDFGKLPLAAAVCVAIIAIIFLKTRRYSVRHRYNMIWIFTTVYIVVSALLAYLRSLLEGGGGAAPLAAAVFLSWGALIAYAYAALIAGLLAIAERLNIVRPVEADR